ncbi:hypothetical protein BOX15_Mlig014377g1 [Macrostomum lignano]|uniref:GAF domain-containing protein n=2 Tax=Macrostomum lignano TaxID=282301 RepID=A0A267H289_9PLAT|nr:hypothetical protein BOX15_Mlig014377g1 [Macrostomum lignano]
MPSNWTALLDYFARLGEVLSAEEFESVAIDTIRELLKCHSVRLQFNEASPLSSWRQQQAGEQQKALTFQCSGYARTLAGTGAVTLLDAAAFRDFADEATRLFGAPPPGGCTQGLVIPVGDRSTSHCLLTAYPAEEVTERHRASMESLRRQLDATCSRLIRLASMGFSGSGGRAPATAAADGGALASTPTAAGSAPLLQSDCHPILALCGELYDQDSEHLQLKVIKYLKNRINCETGFLLLVSQDRAHVFCQVVGDSILPDQIHIGAHMNFFETMIESSKSHYLDDIPQEQLADIQSVLGDSVSIRSLLCVPVTSRGASQVVAIACMVNKLSSADFSSVDVDVIHECFRYTSTVLTSTIAFQTERMLKNQTQALLQVAQNIFRKLDDLTVLLREIMAEARNLTQAERCSVFLLDARPTNWLPRCSMDCQPHLTRRRLFREKFSYRTEQKSSNQWRFESPQPTELLATWPPKANYSTSKTPTRIRCSTARWTRTPALGLGTFSASPSKTSTAP